MKRFLANEETSCKGDASVSRFNRLLEQGLLASLISPDPEESLMFRYLTALFVATLILAPLSYSMSPALAATEDWPQMGDDIVGTSSNTETGKSVAISDDGSIIAVGSWELTAPGPGSVRVYELSSGSWTQRGSTLTGLVSGDYFGQGLALSADGLTLAVGAPFNGSSRGQVFVYSWSGTAWVARGSTLTGVATNTQFGYALALSEDGGVVAVGSPNERTSTGKLSVYRWDPTATPPDWGTPATIAGEDTFETFGRSLDLDADGNVLVAGAPRNDDGGADSGETRVFSWDGSAWSAQGAPIEGESAGDLSGHAVAISDDGELIAIGAPDNDDGGADAGHVRTFEWSGTSWVQRGADIDGRSAGDEFGYSVDLGGDGAMLSAGSPKRAS
jgi:hypothetical protein